MTHLIPDALRAHAAFAPYEAQLGTLQRHLDAAFSPSPAARERVGVRAVEQAKSVAVRDSYADRNGVSDSFARISPQATALTPTLSRAAGEGAIPRFIPPPARHLSAIDFERRVVEHNELIVRADNLHDVMNALVWLTFPRTKRAISEAHVALGVTTDGKTRPRRRDVLTLFDEAGAIILSQRDDLKKLHEGHQWRELFVTHRQAFINEARPILFGHGALEQLGCNPHRGLTVKALWLPLARDTPLIDVDTWMVSHIASGTLLAENEHRLPLPIVGVPGWFAENERAECYDEVDVFRALRVEIAHKRGANIR